MAGLMSNLEIPETTKLSTRVAELSSQDSPLMQQAKATGLKSAASRGMLNSTMAGKASQAAALNFVTPIAQQEVSQEFQAQQSGLDRALSQDQQTKQFEFQRGESALDRTLSRETQQKDLDFRGTQAGLDRTLTREQAALDRTLTQQQQASDQQFRSKEAALDRQTQERINNLNLSAADRESASRVLLSFDQLYQQEFESIMANTNLSAEDRTTYLANAKALRDKRLNLFEQMYDVDISW